MAETLAQLAPEERERLWDGMRLYRSALSRAPPSAGLSRIRPIAPEEQCRHRRRGARRLRRVRPHRRQGLRGWVDPNTRLPPRDLSGRAQPLLGDGGPAGAILGGGGIAPWRGKPGPASCRRCTSCPPCAAWDWGGGSVLQALAEARNLGYQRCYLETTADLREATRPLQSLGFVPLPGPLGCTGHDACDLHGAGADAGGVNVSSYPPHPQPFSREGRREQTSCL